MALLTLFGCSLQAEEWNYDNYGDDWTGGCASGMSQSPIDLDTSNLTHENFYADFALKGRAVSAFNNGHAVVFTPTGRQVEIIDNVSGMLENFKLLQFHLHNGSEHTVNGFRYDLEAHFVHANEAFIDGDAENGRLAVFGVFLQGTPGSGGNKHWNKVLTNLPTYEEGMDNENINYITANYNNLLPANNKVFTYEGSLTTPGCNEVVNWTVFSKPIKVSYAAVQNYADSQDGHETYRSTQPLHGREVKYGRLFD